MTDFGLRLRHRAEPLILEDDLQISADIIAALTNFQIAAIRFLWKRLKGRESCIYNDGKHMGKRITIGALIASLIKCRSKTRVLIGCDKEAIVPWIFKLQVFMQKPLRCKLFSGTHSHTDDDDDPIVFVNTSDPEVDWKALVGDNRFTMIVLDIPTFTHRYKFSPYLLSANFVAVICSADVTRTQTALLEGFLKCFNYSNWYSKLLRRTNEQHLREFPWLDQNKFGFRFQQWKGSRSVNDIIRELNNTSTSFAVARTSTEGMRVLEETQEMSALLFETDDEDIPIEQEIRLPSVTAAQSSLLGSMYLRISQSFANNTPKQKIAAASLVVQDSPDLFASLLDDSEEEDLPNECNISTPNSPTCSLLAIPSQSPINDTSTEVNCPITDCTIVNSSSNNNKSDVFDITVNEVFANRIKVTTSQNLHPVEINKKEDSEEEEEQLKFSTPEILLRTPTRKTSGKRSSVSPSTPSGWLSKRTMTNRTPEKVLVKKRKSLVQFYNATAESRNDNDSLDLSSLDDSDGLLWLKDPDI